MELELMAEGKAVGKVYLDLEMNWGPFIEQLRQIADAIESVTNG